MGNFVYQTTHPANLILRKVLKKFFVITHHYLYLVLINVYINVALIIASRLNFFIKKPIWHSSD